MRLPTPLVVATHNPGKRADWVALLAPLGVELRWPEGEAPDETGTTYVENAVLKARAAAERANLPALADDTGLEIPALGNAPGLDTRPWAEAHGGWTAAARLLVERAGVGAEARFVCGLALVWPDGRVVTARGEVEGTLCLPRQAASSFHPILCPLGDERTFAELSDDERRARDHRAAALRRLLAPPGSRP